MSAMDVDIPANPHVVEVTDQNFVDTVVEGSKDHPVVVDFWAAWCQPCRLIGPVLERLAAEKEGAFVLGKLDIDANPQAAAAFRIQSIPAVKAFRDGLVVDEFVGAIPETSIRQFIDSVVPTEADTTVVHAQELEAAGRLEDAERLYERAFELDPKNVGAALGLGRLAVERGDQNEARRLLQPLRPDPEAERILAAIEVAEWSTGREDRVPGPMADAERAAAEGRFAEALERMLTLVQGGGDERGPAREAMVKVFAVLGDADPLTVEYRRKLAGALF